MWDNYKLIKSLTDFEYDKCMRLIFVIYHNEEEKKWNLQCVHFISENVQYVQYAQCFQNIDSAEIYEHDIILAVWPL